MVLIFSPQLHHRLQHTYNRYDFVMPARQFVGKVLHVQYVAYACTCIRVFITLLLLMKNFIKVMTKKKLTQKKDAI